MQLCANKLLEGILKNRQKGLQKTKCLNKEINVFGNADVFERNYHVFLQEKCRLIRLLLVELTLDKILGLPMTMMPYLKCK